MLRVISRRRIPIKSLELRSPERALDSQDINCIILFPDKSYFEEPGLPEKEVIRSDAVVNCQISY